MAFRFVVSACFVGGLMLMFSFSGGDAEVRVFPRRNVCLAEIPISKAKTMYYIADRDNIHIGKGDKKLIEYISQRPGEKCIAITGLSGVMIIKEMRKLNNVKVIELSHLEQDTIERVIGLREPLPTVISSFSLLRRNILVN